MNYVSLKLSLTFILYRARSICRSTVIIYQEHLILRPATVCGRHIRRQLGER